MDLDNDDLVRFIAIADENRLEYIMIGGMALILNGAVRYTEDADVWMEPTNENRDRLLNVLRELGFTDDELLPLVSTDFTHPQIIRLEEGIDILTVVHRKFDYAECRERARAFTTAGGQIIYFLHVNDLRETKVLARRTKDLNDILMIDELLAARREQDESETNDS